MVATQIEARGIKDKRVIEAMRRVPRHLFVPEDLRARAYDDEPLPIGEGQTISQPYIVAFMTEALELRGREKVLEIGTGSGYQTAVLAELAREVYTVEILGSLSARAETLLGTLGVTHVRFRVGDGSFGWSENAPYDAIIVTAAPAAVPKGLQDQLAQPGRMVIPVGAGFQELILVRRDERGIHKSNLLSVRFVPLVSTH
jgi:protein-L-isoaspartate(D-aspartate) O-methyltransferase